MHVVQLDMMMNTRMRGWTFSPFLFSVGYPQTRHTSDGRPSCFCRRRTPRRVTLRLSVTPDTHVYTTSPTFFFIYYLPFLFSVGKSNNNNNFSENGLKIISAFAAVSAAAHRPTMFGRWWSPPFFFSLFFFSKNTSEEVYTANIFWALRFHVRPDVLNI